MSKSLGNGVDPVDIANRLGGEIVRLWVASIDFREDMAASENLMQRCADIYRKLRNTFRFLLGNLNGFVPPATAWPRPSCCRSTAIMLARTRELTENILDWYERFEFHRVYHAVNDFAVARPEQLLSRRAQGPHVHLRADQPSAPLRANSAMADH
jgi:isoleucyl-tRNA synthetase